MSYQPDLYDVVTPSAFLGDVTWYRDLARASGGPVLELGAGTGRVALAIAEAGVAIHALDANPRMLQVLRSKLAARPADVQARVTLIPADMRTFDLGEQFALIICPFRTFLHNLTESDQLACLNRVRQHLRPLGRFAFNVFHPSLTLMAQHTGPFAGIWRWVDTYALPTGGWVVRSEANRYDTVGQIVHSLHRYDAYGPDGTLERSSMLRLDLAYLYLADIQRLLTTAGFRDITIKGGFDGREFSREGEELVVEAM
jgi:SAM-dependent methyltransferase